MSEVLQGNALNRIDSTFFTKEALAVDATLRARPHATVSELATSILSFGAYALTNDFTYVDEGVPFLRCADISDGFVSFSNCLFIDKKAHKLLRKSAIEPETVLLSMSGSVGNVAVALPSWKYPVNSNQDVAKIKTVKIDSYYLAAFFGSSYGQLQINRLPVGSVQQHIFLSMIETLLVARFEPDFEKEVSALMRMAYSARNAAAATQRGAEEALLDALGLKGWSPPEPLTYARSAAQVCTAGRLDAQYYMPAKFAVLDRLGALPGQPLAALVHSVRDMFDPGTGPRDTRVRNYDLTDALQSILDDSIAPETLDTIESQKKRMEDGDLAVARLRSYLREIAVVRRCDDLPIVGSSEFFVLRARRGAHDLSAEALLVYLRSAPVQTVLKWCQDGSQHPRFSEHDLLAIPVPNLVRELSQDLKASMRTSFAARARSRALLAAATRAVEVAVEQGEAAALAFLAAAQRAAA